MSYLLKALEQAEKDREQQSLNESVVRTQIQEASRLPYGIIAFIVIALGATFLKVLWPSETKENLDSLPVSHVAINKPVTSQSTFVPNNREVLVQDEKVVPILIKPESIVNPSVLSESLHVSDEADSNVNTIVPSNNFSPSKKLENANDALELYELPKTTLAMIPSITMESHIYSSASEYRSVVINGRTFNEGMMLNTHVVLKTITNKGVILNVAGQKVSIEKGTTWVASQNAK